MRVLLINGSPKGTNSNTIRLAEAFLDGFLSASCEVTRLQLNQLDIRPCLGCFSCWSKTPGTCCIHDDMERCLTLLIESDLILWSFPLYYYSVPGALKNFIDRQLPMVLPFMDSESENGGHFDRYASETKRHVIISTCGFYRAKGNYDGVLSLFDHMLGEGNYTTLFCGQGELFRVPELSERTNEYLTWVMQAGREYFQGKIHPDTREKLDALLLPRDVFEKLADASWGVSKETGESEEESLIFTRQMAALFTPAALYGRRLVLEMCYTDLGRRYQILLSSEGSEVLTEHFTEYTTKIETPYTVWNDIACGKISGEEALMRHLYRVDGDFDLMLHWDDYFGGASSQSDPANGISRYNPAAANPADRAGGQNPADGRKQAAGLQREHAKTNMNILLIPWIVFWVAAPIDGQIGAYISIAACTAVPLLFFHNRKTVYDALTGVLVTGLSFLLLSGTSARAVLPLSYLCFGIVWSVSCLFRIPLTACYSMNDYNGEKAFGNPLFVRTNRILTLLWGILYLVTPVWTWILMGTRLSSLTGLINSALPALMGLFTAWFQKWYPAKVARG